MKRGSILLLLILGACLLGSYQPAHSSSIKKKNHGFTHLQLHQSESEAAINISSPVPVHSVTKHLTGNGILPHITFYKSTKRMTSLDLVLTGIHAKNYLLHIYPSMHYW